MCIRDSPWTEYTANQYATGQVQKVYLRINPDVPSLRYVGRHFGACAERDRQHLDGAVKARPDALYSQRLTVRNGGPGMFIDMPVFICSGTATVTDVHRIEQRVARVIKWCQAENYSANLATGRSTAVQYSCSGTAVLVVLVIFYRCVTPGLS